MDTITLAVLDKRMGFGSRKGAYEVLYNGKTEYVNMFKFQEQEPMPETIECFENSFHRLVQSNDVLFARFYADREQLYLFRVKNKWYNYYELEDVRPEVGDDYKPRLLFSKSDTTLEKGDLVRCAIEDVRDGQLFMLLKDKNPSRFSFLSLDDLFHTAEHHALDKWLQRYMESPLMDEVRPLYEARDGKWLFALAPLLPPLCYTLLEEERADKAALLTQLCDGWIAAVEHSPLVEEMGEGDRARYSAVLHDSIEWCEDMAEALRLADKEEAVQRAVAALNPHYYPYRLEKRLRLLVCVAGLQPEALTAHIPTLLQQLHALGEERCCQEPMACPMAFVLGAYVRHAMRRHEPSTAHNETALSGLVKQCATALCYLVRILHRTGAADTKMYVSRLYQLLSLRHKVSSDEKKLLLRNAYRALFAHDTPLHGYKWDELATIVNEKSYRFSRDAVTAADHFSYDAGTTRATLGADSIMLTSAYADAAPKQFTILDEISVTLPADRSLTGLHREQNFQLIQQTWSRIEASLIAASPTRSRKADSLLTGDEVQLYVVSIADRETLRCKIVGRDEEYLVPFKQLFYYPKPKVGMSDFVGADGSPLLFPAVYRSRSGGQDTFDMVRYKTEFAAERMPLDHTVTGLVFSVTPESCLAVTEEGFVIAFDPNGVALDNRSFVDITVTERDGRGRLSGLFEGLADEKHRFDNHRCSANYIRAYNRFHHGGQETTKAMADAGNEDAVSHLHGRYLQRVVDIVSLYTHQLRDARERYCYLQLASLLSKLAGLAAEQQRLAVSLKYTELLYQFALNHTLSDDEVRAFFDRTEGCDGADVRERRKVVEILGRHGRAQYGSGVDGELMQLLTSEVSTPPVKELARLVLAGQLLAGFATLDVPLLDEMGRCLGIDVIQSSCVNLGIEEGSTVEFKTSLVYPPSNGGRADEEQQGENLMRVVRAMMKADGGTLYIGVNDKGDVVGLKGDFDYFAKRPTYDGTNVKDLFRNHFACVAAAGLGAAVAATLAFDFEEREGCIFFRVQIPQNSGVASDYIRIGSTNQRLEA